jgi:hypothetical protein
MAGCRAKCGQLSKDGQTRPPLPLLDLVYEHHRPAEGKSTGGALFNFAPLTLAPVPPIATIRFVSLDPLSEIEASAAAISKG